MSEVRVGDRVRITHEGEVTYENDSSIEINGSWWVAKSGVTVEVVERRKPQVGDVIEKRKHLKRLPEFTVVVNRYGFPLVVRDGYTVNALSVERTPFNRTVGSSGPYTVAYVKE